MCCVRGRDCTLAAVRCVFPFQKDHQARVERRKEAHYTAETCSLSQPHRERDREREREREKHTQALSGADEVSLLLCVIGAQQMRGRHCGGESTPKLFSPSQRVHVRVLVCVCVRIEGHTRLNPLDVLAWQ